jgi:tetratricopeptide (TPR) repeat protein
MGFFNNWNENRRIKYYLNKHLALYKKGKYKEGLKIIEEGLKEFPDDILLLEEKCREMIHRRNLREIDKIFKKFQTFSNEKIEKLNFPRVIQEDLVIKDEKDAYDENIDTIISDKEINTRKKIKNSEELIISIIRRALYLCLKFNARIVHGTWINYPAKQIRFLAELNIKYCPLDTNWVLHWFYKEGMYAIERSGIKLNNGNIVGGLHDAKYGLEILNEYINLTKNNKDEMAHNKYYSRGLAYFNLGKYNLANKDFNTSLKFTNEKSLIKEVQEILEETKRRLKK